MIHVHYRIDANIHGFGSFFDFFSLVLVRLRRSLHDLETHFARHFETVRSTELRGQHFEPNTFLDGKCWWGWRRPRGFAGRQRVGQRSAAETC